MTTEMSPSSKVLMAATMAAKITAWRNKREILPLLKPILGNDPVTANQVYNYLYSKGKLLPPNFPVPAIRNEIELLPNRVILWTKYNDIAWDMKYLAQDYS